MKEKCAKAGSPYIKFPYSSELARTKKNIFISETRKDKNECFERRVGGKKVPQCSGCRCFLFCRISLYHSKRAFLCRSAIHYSMIYKSIFSLANKSWMSEPLWFLIAVPLPSSLPRWIIFLFFLLSLVIKLFVAASAAPIQSYKWNENSSPHFCVLLCVEHCHGFWN